MRKLCLLLLAALPLFAAPLTAATVSNVFFANVSYSTLRVVFKSDSAFTNARVLWAATPNVCTSDGTTGGGSYQFSAYSGSAGYNALSLSGLTPNTSYQFCPEISTDNGSTWTSGVGAVQLMKSAPTTFPIPIHPPQIDISYPDFTKGTCWSNSQPGYCVVVEPEPCVIGAEYTGTLPAASGELNNDIANAIHYQAVSGTIIEIPAGDVCSDNRISWSVLAPDVARYVGTDIASNAITMPNALSSYTQWGANGITEGSGMYFMEPDYGADVPNVTAFDGSSEQLPPDLFFAHVTGANSFQLYWPYTRTTGNVVKGNTTISLSSLIGQGGDTVGVLAGAEVIGNGIPADTVVVSVDQENNTAVLSAAPTVSAQEEVLVFGGGTNPQGTTDMPLQITAPASSSVEPAIVPYPRGLNYVDIVSCVSGTNCIANWNSDASYSIGNRVASGGYIYTALTANTDSPPPGSDWQQTETQASSMDETLPPVGTRITPEWASNLAILEPSLALAYAAPPFINTGSIHDHGPGNDMAAGNIRFDGLEFAEPANPQKSANPRNYAQYIDVSSDDDDYNGLMQSTSNIYFDRIFVNIPFGYDNRTWVWSYGLNGHGFAFDDSYVDEWNFAHAGYNSASLVAEGASSSSPTPSGTIGSTSITIPTQSISYGADSPAVISDPLTVSWTGTPDSSIATPEIAVYFDMNGNLDIAAPTGVSVTSSQPATIETSTTQGNMSCSQGDALIPVDSYGTEAAAPVGCAQLSASGTLTAISSGEIISNHVEGCNCIIAGGGPGPWNFVDDYFFGTTGVDIHFDNGATWQNHHDYLFKRDFFQYDMRWLNTFYSASGQHAGIPTLGYNQYTHSQWLEWKSGSRIWIDGTIFDGGIHAENGSDGSPVDMTAGSSQINPVAISGPGITNLDVTNDTYEHQPSAIECPSDVYLPSTPQAAAGPYMDPPNEACRIENNLLWDISGPSYSSYDGPDVGEAGGKGYAFDAPGEFSENTLIDHNTSFDSFGTEVQLIYTGAPLPIYGFRFTNNIAVISSQGASSPPYTIWTPCGETNDAALTDCLDRPNTQSAFAGNVFVSGWKSAFTNPPTGGQLPLSTIQSILSTHVAGNTWITNGTSVGDTLNSIGWTDLHSFDYPTDDWGTDGKWSGPNINWHLLSSSLYNFGQTTDGLQEGANIDQLEAAQGKVTLVGANQITADSANITYVAPDATSCWVDYSSTDPTVINSFTRVQDAGGSRVRNVSITGLSSQTVYHFRVDCAVQQPSGQFRTN